MAGTKLGGLRAAATNKLKYGEDFYQVQGAKGGSKSTTGGWYHMKIHNPERVSELGRLGGQRSRRRKRNDYS